MEPIKSTNDPYSKMEMGIPFTRRPKALRFDYKVQMPAASDRIYSSGFSKKKTYKGHDTAEVYILLQRRWEDADGNLYAKRVGTGRERYGKSTNGWINGHEIPVMYGDITNRPNYKPYMGLIPADKNYYARRNSDPHACNGFGRQRNSLYRHYRTDDVGRQYRTCLLKRILI